MMSLRQCRKCGRKFEAKRRRDGKTSHARFCTTCIRRRERKYERERRPQLARIARRAERDPHINTEPTADERAMLASIVTPLQIWGEWVKVS